MTFIDTIFCFDIRVIFHGLTMYFNSYKFFEFVKSKTEFLTGVFINKNIFNFSR